MTPLGRGVRLLAGSGFALGVVTLVLTQSRGAWIGAVVAIAALIVLLRRRSWLPSATLMAFGLLGVAVFAALGSAITERVASFGNAAALSRLPLMALAFDVIVDHPVLGVGANNFAHVLPSYITVQYSGEWISTVHNKYLLVWAETGIIGLAAWLWFLGRSISAAFEGWAARDRVLSPIALGLGLGLLGSMIHATVAIYHGRVHVQMIMLVAGLSVAGYRLMPKASIDPSRVRFERRDSVGADS
jgi:O-antigen ligase